MALIYFCIGIGFFVLTGWLTYGLSRLNDDGRNGA